MDSFMQVLYGTVVAVSFYVVYRDSDNVNQDIIERINKFSSSSISKFKITLFIFSLLIAAHDWFSYHARRMNRENFFAYIPSMFSLFFIAQMFSCSAIANLNAWYFFAGCYTICNIGSLIIFAYRKKEGMRSLLKWDCTNVNSLLKLSVHLLITAFGWYLVDHDFLINGNKSIAWTMLIITIVIVVTIWIYEECKRNSSAEICCKTTQ